MRLHRFALIPVLALSACGGDEPEGEMTRAQFVERADALCAEHAGLEVCSSSPEI